MFARHWAFPLLFFVFSMICESTVTGAELRGDVEYARADGVSLRLDASVPEGPGPFPAAIIVHGGGWVSGDRRTNVQPLFQPLSQAGFVWFSIDYRLLNDVTQFGLAINDVQEAIRYVKSHAAEYRVDPGRIALVGESAGGQLASIATLRGGPDTAVKAVVAIYAPTDLVSLLKTSTYVSASIRNSVLGTPWEGLIMGAVAQLSPLNNVRRDMPPFLFIHGTADNLVPFEQSRVMCDRMKSVGAACELYPVEGAGHGIRWWESANRASGYKEEMIRWLRRQFAVPSRS